MTTVDARIETVGPAVIAEWEALALRVDGSPFVFPGWLLPWHAAFGSGTLQLVTARGPEGGLLAVLPLVDRRVGLGSPTNWHTPQFSVLARDDRAHDAVLAAAVRASRWQLELSFVDQQTVDQVTRAARRLGHPVMSRILESSPYIDLGATHFDSYLANLPRHARAEIRRRTRNLAKLGPVTFEVHETADPTSLGQFLAVEDSGWKADRGTSVLRDPGAAAFYPAMARWAADMGWLRLALLLVGDRVIAGDLAIQAQGVHYLLKTGHDEEFRAFGPGKILRLEMIRRAFADRLSAYEFLGDQDPWKQEWTDEVRHRMRVQTFGRGAAGRVAQGGQLYVRPVAKRGLAEVRRWRTRP